MKVSGGGIGRKRRRENDYKGFTLVELIVVIVILAILAAILIPGLLKWIDEAKDKQYKLEAKSIAQAAQAEAIKLYGRGETLVNVHVDGLLFYDDPDDNTNDSHVEELDNIKKLSGINNISFVQLWFEDGAENTGKIIMVFMRYQSSDGKDITATWMADHNEWGIN